MSDYIISDINQLLKKFQDKKLSAKEKAAQKTIHLNELIKKLLQLENYKDDNPIGYVYQDDNYLWKLNQVNFNDVRHLIIEIDEELNNLKNEESEIISDNFFQHCVDYLKDIMEDLLYDMNNKNKSKFPSLYDNEFNKKIYENNEFNKYKYESKSNNKSVFFEKFTYQKFLRRFMSKDTPYNGLLIYHGVGVGKSCSAISIVEEFKEIYKYNKNNIYVINPNNQLQESFKKEIFNIDKEENKGLLQNVQCTGNSYTEKYKKINLDEKKRKKEKGKGNEKEIDMLINEYYSFLTLGKKIPKYYINQVNINKKNINKKKIISFNKQFNKKIKNIKRDFSNKIIICDEIHEYRIDEEEITKINRNGKNVGEIKKISQLLKNIARYAVNTKFVLLSATPIFDNYTEIEFILNLLLVNDNRAPIQKSKIFKRNGEISEKFRRKLTGYVSYIRGNDPIKFPLKIYPKLSSSYSIMNDYNVKEMYKDKKGLLSSSSLIWEIIGIKNKDNEKKEEKLNDLKKIFNLNKNSRQQLLFYKNELDVDSEQGKKYLDTVGKEAKNKILYINNFNECIKNIIKNKNNEKKLEILKKHSIKFYNIICNLENSDGITFIYSRFVEDCINKLIKILIVFGYNHLKKSNKEVESNSKNFVVLQGDNSRDIVSYINLINRNDNKNGEKIKIILGTPAIERGYSFFNVRSVHILEPWFNLSRINQIIGRATRTFSHQQLEDSKQNVTIYLHSTKLIGKEQLTIDEERWIYSFLKKLQTIKIEQVLKEKSIDCLLNKKINHFTNNNYPEEDYPFLYNRTVIDHKNIEIQNVNYLDIDYNELCNFKECMFECNNEQNIDKDPLKDKQINKHLQNSIINKLVKILLKNIFDNKLIYKLNEISDDIKELRKYKIKVNYTYNEWLKLLKFALDKMIKDKRIVYSYQGVKGRIIKKENEYYVFQPIYLKNIHLPLYSRYIENADYDNIENLVSNNKNHKVKKELKIEKIDNEKIIQKMDNYINELHQFLKYVKVYWFIGLLKKDKIKQQDEKEINIIRPYIYIHNELLKINEIDKNENLKKVLKEANLNEFNNPDNQGILSTLIVDIINFRENISNNILLNINYKTESIDDFRNKINIIEHTRINNGINDKHVGPIILNILNNQHGKNEKESENIISDIKDNRIIKNKIKDVFPYYYEKGSLKLNDKINNKDNNNHSKIIWIESENKYDPKNKYISNENLKKLKEEDKKNININKEIVKKIDNKLISIYFLRFFEFNNNTEKILDLLRYFYFKCFNDYNFKKKYIYLYEIFDNYYNNNKETKNLNLINEIDGKQYFISSNIFYKIKGDKWYYDSDKIKEKFNIEEINNFKKDEIILNSFKVYLIYDKKNSIKEPILSFDQEINYKSKDINTTMLLNCLTNKVEFIKNIYNFNNKVNDGDDFGEFNKEIFAYTLDKYSGKYGPYNKKDDDKKNRTKNKLIEENQIIVGKNDSINLNILKENDWHTTDVVQWENWYNKNENLQHLPGSFYSTRDIDRKARYSVNAINYGLGVFFPENFLEEDKENNKPQIKRPIIMNKTNINNLSNTAYKNVQKKFRYCNPENYFHFNTKSPIFINLVLYLFKKIINKYNDKEDHEIFLNENNFIIFNNGYSKLEAHIESNCYVKYYWKKKKNKRPCNKKESDGAYAVYPTNDNVKKPFGSQDDLNQFIEILCRYLNLENGNELNFFMRKDIAELCSYNLFLKKCADS